MSSQTYVPPEFSHLVDLAADSLGGFALFANDEFFAEKENMLKASAPVFIADKYTDKGKWMDGWESQRRRDPYAEGAHDQCVIRLGIPGTIVGFLVDTTHFKGNAPQKILVEGLYEPSASSRSVVIASPRWQTLTELTDVKPDFPNIIHSLQSIQANTFTHVRLRIYPDGGVARFRVYGIAKPSRELFLQEAAIDLVAIENGGTVAYASDAFFGPPSNLLLPGRGTNMGDGWETKRRRTPGVDSCVLKLGRRGIIQRIELDTHFFKGNAPHRTTIEVLDASTLSEAQTRTAMTATQGWQSLCYEHGLDPHRRHTILPVLATPATHVRVHIDPHGGVNRLRLFGHALADEQETNALNIFHKLDNEATKAFLLSLNGSQTLAELILHKRPYGSIRMFLSDMRQIFLGLSEHDWLEAFAAHPRIGSQHKAASATAISAAWSSSEQSQVHQSEEAIKQRLAEINVEYFQKFGFIFIVKATGKSAEEMLRIATKRLQNTRETELARAAHEQAMITELRILKWIES